MKLALLAASPVYYQAPLYRRLALDPRLDFTAIFASSAGVRPGDFGYGSPVAFDADALGGYRSVFLRRSDTTESGRGGLFDLCDPDVVSVLVAGDYDALWMHGYYSCTHLAAALTQRMRRRPLLLRDDQTLQSPRAGWKRALKHTLFRTILRDAVPLPVGTANEAWWRHYGLRRPSFLVPNCVDTARLRADASALAGRDELRLSFGIRADAGPLILFVGRLVPKKQPELLLDAFARVRAERPCSLLIVGAGELEQPLRDRAAKLGVPDVVFAGFLNQTEIPRAYACADVFVLPSRVDETWGLVVNEAMSFELPIIATDRVGATADLVRDGKNGFVVRHDRPDELAERLALLVDSPELRGQMGRASLDLVSTWNYDVAAAGVVDAVAYAVGDERWSAAQAPCVEVAA